MTTKKTNSLPTMKDLRTGTVLLHHIGSDKHPPIELEFNGVPYVLPAVGKRWVLRRTVKEIARDPSTGLRATVVERKWFRPDPKKNEDESPVTEEEATIEVPQEAAIWWTQGKERDKLYEPRDEQDVVDGVPRSLRVVTDREFRRLRSVEDARLDEQIAEKAASLAAINAELEAKRKAATTGRGGGT